jgi:hypothetical protein
VRPHRESLATITDDTGLDFVDVAPGAGCLNAIALYVASPKLAASTLYTHGHPTLA